MDLDKKDLQILELIQADGRISHTELSDRIHLSAPQCLRRLRALEAAGFVNKYVALLNERAVGLGVTAFVRVVIDRDQLDRIRDFEASILGMDEILECYSASGDFDYELKVICRDLDDLAQFLNERLTRLPTVIRIRSTICLAPVKRTTALPLNRAAVSK